MKGNVDTKSTMATSEVVAFLNELKPRLFEGLSPLQVASIVAAAGRRRFPAHSVMAHERYPARHLFLIVRGRARSFCMTPQGEKITIFWFPPGEVCGGAVFLSRPVEYLVSTEAVNHCIALEWDRTKIRSLGAQYPELADNALLLAYDYFVMYRALHISATSQTDRQRLAQVLGNLAYGMGQRSADGIELNIRNEELANEAHITIFTASQLLE